MPCAGAVPPLVVTLLLPLVLACGDAQGEKAPAEQPAEVRPIDRIRRALPAFEDGGEAQYPPSAERVLRARESMHGENQKAAYHMLRRELSDNPGNDEAAFFLGVIYQQRANFGGARPHFERVLDHGPTFDSSTEVFYWYGQCLRRLGDPTAAREALTSYLKLEPAQAKGRSSLGQLAMEEGDLDAAAAHLEAALEAYFAAPGERPDQEIAEVYASLGEVHMQRGELEQAEEALRTCVRLWPGGYDHYYKLARVLGLRGDAEGAERAMTVFEHRESAPVR